MTREENLRINGAKRINKTECTKQLLDEKLFRDKANKIIENWDRAFLSQLPHLRLVYSESLRDYDVMKKMKKIRDSYPNSELRPDLGTVFLVETDNKLNLINKEMLFMGEFKKQGTNDELIKEGKQKQAIGNAIERLSHQIMQGYYFCEGGNICPVISFCYGCDTTEAYIQHKLERITRFEPLNKNNMFKKCPSIYTSHTKFTEEFVFDVFKRTVFASLCYYVKNYCKENKIDFYEYFYSLAKINSKFVF